MPFRIRMKDDLDKGHKLRHVGLALKLFLILQMLAEAVFISGEAVFI